MLPQPNFDVRHPVIDAGRGKMVIQDGVAALRQSLRWGPNEDLLRGFRTKHLGMFRFVLGIP